MRWLTVLFILPGCAPAYLSIEGGPTRWNGASSNDTVIEASAPGYMIGGSLGARTGYGRVEVSASYRRSNIHDCNGDCAELYSDEPLHVGSLGINAWPGLRWKWVEVYAGGGVGASCLHGLGDTECGPYWQAGGGLVFHLEQILEVPISIDAGYRINRVLDMTLSGHEIEYGTDGPVIRLTWEF